MYLRPVSGVVVLLLILYSSVDDAVSGDPANPISEVLINCGSVHNHETLNGRRWFGDEHTKSKFSDWWLQIKGSSTSSNHKSSISAGVYRTARISGSRFLYVIRLNPGQVILRLHFNPTSYKGFTSFQDLFTVEAAQFTLLGNFSASLTAHALGATTFTKDFSISIGENIPLIIVFSPSVSRTTYAFVNGIEIVYVPEHLTYFGEQEYGTYVVGEKSLIYVGNNTALEIIHQFKVKQGDLSPNDEFDMFGEWGTTAQKQHTGEIKNITWRRSVHAGFRYLVRVHFSKQGLVMAKSNNVMFNLLINQNIVQTRTDIVNALIENEKANCCYRDYLMVIKGRKQDPQREILIFLESSNIFMDGYGLVQGFEMLKLSNADNSLASPNPCPPAVHAPCSFLCYLGSFLYYLLGSFRISDLLVSLVLVIIIPLIIGTHRAARPYMRTNIPDTNNSVVQTPETSTPVLKNNPPAKAARKGRKFSLAQIIDATQNFSNEHIIGHGGFGTVYIGQIDEDTVAIKRHNSARLDQGEKEFWAEVETLSELRHLNLVSLIGHCNECGEMILVYQYMPNGTLEDHLFKPANGSEHWSPLTWKQRLQICIGAARGIEYLHTGTEKGVLHRDIKASNILLDENFIAKVSDFGLARPEVRGNSGAPFSTEIKGTYGYMDPDYMQNGEPSRKIDIYAFGVVLLEVLSGISVIREKSEFLNLLKKVQNKISSKEVEQLVASSLKGEIPKASLNLFFDIAQKCVHKDPKDRMQSMAHVVAKLQLELAKVTDEQPKGNTAGDKDGKLKANKTLYDYLISRGWKKKSSKGNETVPKASSGSAPGCSTSNEPDSFDVIVPLESNSDYRIALVAVQAATNNFDESRLIGVGGFGEVYKGVLNGLDVAVKRGKQPREQCGNAELNADIEMLCQIRHEHLVPLIGYCDENNENILVYEYMENGSLKSHLYDKNLPTLGWKERVEICIGVAKGLLHLHKYHLGAVTHGDLRSSNIFLDKNNVARVSDSGLSRMRPENAQNIVGTITHEMGTTTVVDDHFKKPPTKRSDTYWLGILFWEVCMGRRVADPSLPEDIEELAKRTMKLYDMGRLDDYLIDPDLVGKVETRSLKAFGSAAAKCMAPTSGEDGPSLGHVLMDLRKALQGFPRNEYVENSNNEIETLASP